MKRTSTLACLAVLLAPGVAGAQLARLEVVEQPILFECAKPGSPCFRVTLEGLDAAGNAAQLPGTASRYSAIALGTTAAPRVFLVEPADESLAGSGGTTLTMVLVDLSGSMRLPMDARRRDGERRFEVAKKVLRRFVDTTFAEGRDRYAVVGFHSREVARGVEGATFVSTKDEAIRQVEALAEPQGRNNTALYSVTVAALERLVREGRDRSMSARLVLFTDGKNEVGGAADDPQLLDSSALARVAGEVVDSRLEVITVGFGQAGSLDERALRRLASSEANYSFAGNEAELERVFSGIRQRQATRLHLWVAGVAPAIDRLTGQTVRLRIGVDRLETTSETEKAWKSPTFSGATGAEPPMHVRTAFIDCCLAIVPPPPWPKLLLVSFGLGSLLAVAWFAVPRFIWPLSYIPKPAVERPRPPAASRRGEGPASSVVVPSRRPPPSRAPDDAGGTVVAGGRTEPAGREPRARLAQQPPRPAPKERPDPPPRDAGDATVYIPRAKKFEKDV